jgi:hypothetical protein
MNKFNAKLLTQLLFAFVLNFVYFIVYMLKNYNEYGELIIFFFQICFFFFTFQKEKKVLYSAERWSAGGS